MRLPQVPGTYSGYWASELTRRVEAMARDMLRKNSDIEIAAGRLILTSPNGTRYSVTVDDAGALTTTVI